VNLPEVTQAMPADRDRVIETVVSAFVADPAFRFFFPDDASYAHLAGTFVGHLFDRRARHGTVWIIDGGAAVSMWDGPSAPGTAGGESAPLELPPDVTARLDSYDAAVHAWLPHSPHWYLGIVATHPQHVGRRWGRATMAAGLHRAATDGLPAYLETTNPRNVELYQRAGWEIVQSLTAQTLDVWVMSSSS
jgi:GNAT superfamily N-acetyltransferase